ncbi:trehalase-like [Agrilus planipennis]|uniref:Trehalase n=1 Tax=Agrilus planipennis TaxID=224129 RepID=A0A1W4XME4_AGRPL|nr:trehalase-like [Agrilus planipennis]
MQYALVLLLLVTILAGCSYSIEYGNLPPPCDSQIFCYGDILEAIQLSGIFSDSKTFVDLKLKKTVPITLEAFKDISKDGLDRAEIEEFVQTHFENVEAIEQVELTDFKRNQTFLNEICNATVQAFTRQLIEIWPELSRKVKDEVYDNPEQYSFIPVPNHFIIPGGRFREYYYWDSYWVIEGLLISEMYDTARQIIENFLYLVETIGFIPNGGRVYYLNRSQPPLLASMVSLYYNYTKDVAWVEKHIDVVAKELAFWLANKTTTVQTENGNYTLARYYVPYSGPRPESYAEDFETASVWTDLDQRQKTYVELKSGAESGWDFSSRWIFDESGNANDNLSGIEASRIIPVDLNSFLCHGFRKVAELYEIIDQNVDSNLWYGVYKSWVEAVDSVLWNSDENIWLDFDIQLKRHRRAAYPTHVTPLWAGCHSPEKDKAELVRHAYNYLTERGLLAYLGGLPTSLLNTTQQWDFPNAWPPIQHLVVYSLVGNGVQEAEEAAHSIVKKWIDSNILGFIDSGEMYEKYDAEVPGQYGGGGEYTVQSGFGWTNGIAFKFIYDYYRCE